MFTMATTANFNTSQEDMTIMVEDYLNDRLQDPADMENIDTLLLDIQEHQDLLKKQVGDNQFTIHFQR